MESNLSFQLPIGIPGPSGSGTVLKDVDLLPINGVAEKIILKKLKSKPYSWLARIFTFTFARIGQKDIAQNAREAYLKTGEVTTSPIITRMCISDTYTAIIEVHRKLWENELSRQPYSCPECNHQGEKDMDLNFIEYAKDDRELLESSDDLTYLLDIEVPLSNPIIFQSPKRMGSEDQKSHVEYDGKNVTALLFKAPTLKNAIDNEKHIKEENMVDFWRFVARDCLRGAKIDVSGDGTSEIMDDDAFKILKRADLFNTTLHRKDLKKVRDAMYCDDNPALNFITEIECGSCGSDIPAVISPSSFFSE